MIEVRYIYSACVVLTTPDIKIVCDPWFTEGVYDGSWYQYPKVNQPLDRIGKVDAIYVSHIHPDHFDPVFLKTYLKKYPDVKVFIADFPQNFLSQKMKIEGIPHRILTEETIGNTQLKIAINDDEDPYNIDSALGIKYEKNYVVNMNDNLFNQEQIEALLSFGGYPDIALLGYTGAGPYPQTYYCLEQDKPTLLKKSQAKKEDFFKRYLKMKEALKPKKTIPFAGKYILGGKLSHLNDYRGVADAVEVTQFDGDAIVLADGGFATLNTQTLRPSAVRTECYNMAEQNQYIDSLSTNLMEYEVYYQHFPINKIPLKRLLPVAYKRAIQKSKIEQDYYFCIQLPNSEWFVMNANKTNESFSITRDVTSFQPRSEILIDARYLYGLLTCVFHWNNAEVGSQYFCRRIPDEFNREAQNFLSFLHV